MRENEFNSDCIIHDGHHGWYDGHHGGDGIIISAGARKEPGNRILAKRFSAFDLLSRERNRKLLTDQRWRLISDHRLYRLYRRKGFKEFPEVFSNKKLPFS